METDCNHSPLIVRKLSSGNWLGKVLQTIAEAEQYFCPISADMQVYSSIKVVILQVDQAIDITLLIHLGLPFEQQFN